MNMMGNLGGAVGPVVTGYLVGASGVSGPDAAHGWTMAMLVTSALYGLGAVAWLFLDPETPLDKAVACETPLP
jgi:MFS family permease